MRWTRPHACVRVCVCLGLLSAMALAAGCGGSDGGFETSGFSSERLPEAGEAPLTESPAALPAAAPAPGAAGSCPQLVAWPNERLRTVYQRGRDGENDAVVYRGEITKLSRECRYYGGGTVVKYGFAGRVLLGPKGSPGAVSLPVSIRVADPYKATLARDKVSVRVTIPHNNPVGYFSMVREISFPVRPGTRPEDYKIFVSLK